MYIFNSVPYSYQLVNAHWQSVLDGRFILFSLLHHFEFEAIGEICYWIFCLFMTLKIIALFVFFQKQHNLILCFLMFSSFIYCKLYYSSKTKIIEVCRYIKMHTLSLIGIDPRLKLLLLKLSICQCLWRVACTFFSDPKRTQHLHC